MASVSRFVAILTALLSVGCCQLAAVAQVDTTSSDADDTASKPLFSLKKLEPRVDPSAGHNPFFFTLDAKKTELLTGEDSATMLRRRLKILQGKMDDSVVKLRGRAEDKGIVLRGVAKEETSSLNVVQRNVSAQFHLDLSALVPKVAPDISREFGARINMARKTGGTVEIPKTANVVPDLNGNAKDTPLFAMTPHTAPSIETPKIAPVDMPKSAPQVEMPKSAAAPVSLIPAKTDASHLPSAATSTPEFPRTANTLPELPRKLAGEPQLPHASQPVPNVPHTTDAAPQLPPSSTVPAEFPRSSSGTPAPIFPNGGSRGPKMPPSAAEPELAGAFKGTKAVPAISRHTLNPPSLNGDTAAPDIRAKLKQPPNDLSENASPTAPDVTAKLQQPKAQPDIDVKLIATNVLSKLAIPNVLPKLALPNTVPTVACPSTATSIRVPTTSATMQAPNTNANIHAPNTNANIHAPNTNANLHLPNTNATIELPNTNAHIDIPSVGAVPCTARSKTDAAIRIASTSATIHMPSTNTSLAIPTTHADISFPGKNISSIPSLKSNSVPSITAPNTVASVDIGKARKHVIDWDPWHKRFAAMAREPLLSAVNKIGNPLASNTVEITVLPNRQLQATLKKSSDLKFDQAVLQAYRSLSGRPELAYPAGSMRSSVSFLVDNKHQNKLDITVVTAKTIAGDKEIQN